MYSIGSARLAMPIIAFEEWVADPIYYDKLTDRDEDAEALFKKYKGLMDEEFDGGCDEKGDGSI